MAREAGGFLMSGAGKKRVSQLQLESSAKPAWARAMGNSGRDSSSLSAKIRHRVHVGGVLRNFSSHES